MRLITITSQSRRDFRGTYQCEGCGHMEENVSGYDDANFHENVMPNRKCKECGKTTVDLGLEPDKIKTRYEPWQVI